MDLTNVISLLAGVALFLFGMTLMGDGLKKVAGKKLELVLYRLTSTPLKGIMLGTGVTAVIQSSSATSVMVVGFVNSGMMPFRNAIGIVLGAILGTSITGWVICLSALEGAGGWGSLLSTSSNISTGRPMSCRPTACSRRSRRPITPIRWSRARSPPSRST